MVDPHGGQLGAAGSPWGSCQAPSQPQQGAGQTQPSASDTSLGSMGGPAQGLPALRGLKGCLGLRLTWGRPQTAGQGHGGLSVPLSPDSVSQRESLLPALPWLSELKINYNQMQQKYCVDPSKPAGQFP